MTEKTFKELRAEATAKGITVPFGTKKEQLQQLINNPVEQAEQPKKVEEQNKTVPKEPSNSIPDDLKNLNLISVRKMTKEDVRVDRLVNQKRKLDVSPEIKEELEREGYKLLFPIDTDDSLNGAIRRGAEFVTHPNGTSIKISAQQSNAKGELQYHIAMKIKKEILDEEARQQRNNALSLREKHRTGNDELKADIGAPDSYVKFTNNNDNKI